MVFDFHTHFFPDNIATGTLESLEKDSGFQLKPFTAGTRASLLESMKDAGIDYSLNLPVATNPDKVERINDVSAMLNCPPIYTMAAMHPLTPEPARVLYKAAKLGFKGIKMHPEFQNFDPLDPEIEVICGECIKLGLFIFFHAGPDIFYKPPYRSEPAKFAELHRRFPRLKMILAHLGSWKMWKETDRLLAGLPVYFDTSFTSGLIDEDHMCQIIRKHDPEYVLFGSDSPWQGQKESLDFILGLPLTDEEKELILHRNAFRLLGI